MPVLYVAVGPSGSGKSSFRKTLPDSFVVASSDDFILTQAKYYQMTYSQAFDEYVGQATKAYEARIDTALMFSKDIFVDRTNLNRASRAKLFKLCDKHKSFENYKIVFLNFYHESMSKAMKAKQLHERTLKREHVISEKIISDQIYRFEYPSIDEHKNVIAICDILITTKVNTDQEKTNAD